MRRMARVLAPLTTLLFVILTSSDVTTLAFVALHLPPTLALEAVAVLAIVLLARRAWRRWTKPTARVPGLTAVPMLFLAMLLYPQPLITWPLTTWLRLTLSTLR